MRSPSSPEFIQKTDGILLVDGHDGFGQYIGHVAMARAIESARTTGVGLVAVRNSNHYGAGAYFVQMAAREGMVGFAFTNATRRGAAAWGNSPIFGSKPRAFGAPFSSVESLLIEFL